jgi:hypothetical protein
MERRPAGVKRAAASSFGLAAARVPEDRRKLRDALARIGTFQGMVGPITLNPDDHPVKPREAGRAMLGLARRRTVRVGWPGLRATPRSLIVAAMDAPFGGRLHRSSSPAPYSSPAP